MPKVHFVKKARQDNPAVKKGESYYHWSFRYGGKRYSKTRPRQSQLTQSKWSDIYAAMEEIEDATDLDALKDAISSAIDTVDNCASEYYDASEPFGYEGPNAERHEKCEEISSELQGLDDDADFEDLQQEALNVDWEPPC